MAKFIEIEDTCVNIDCILLFFADGDNNKTKIMISKEEVIGFNIPYADVKKLIEEKSK